MFRLCTINAAYCITFIHFAFCLYFKIKFVTEVSVVFSLINSAQEVNVSQLLLVVPKMFTKPIFWLCFETITKYMYLYVRFCCICLLFMLLEC